MKSKINNLTRSLNFLTLSRGTYNKLIWHAEVHKLGQILKFCGGQFYLNSVSFSENCTNFEAFWTEVSKVRVCSDEFELKFSKMS